MPQINPPQQIAILSHAERHGGPAMPRFVNYGGPVFPLLPDHGPAFQQHSKGLITLAGHVYRWQRHLGQRANGRGWYIGDRYQLFEGWQVLVTQDGGTAPDLKWPHPDQSTAEEYARRVVTENLILGTALQATVVWQQGTAYGEPVATIDGHDFSYGQAVAARAHREYLPIAHPPPKENGEEPPSPEPKDPPAPIPESQRHYSTERAVRQAPIASEARHPVASEARHPVASEARQPDLNQAQSIAPVWGDAWKTRVKLNSGTTIVVDVPHSDLEAQVRALGWTEGSSGMGFWISPTFDRQAELARPRAKYAGTALEACYVRENAHHQTGSHQRHDRRSVCPRPQMAGPEAVRHLRPGQRWHRV